MKSVSKILTLTIFFAYFSTAQAIEFSISSCPSTTNLFDHMSSQIDDRILGVTASDSTKSLFSTRGNLTSPWVWNSSVWTKNISPVDFTGMSPWNSTGGYTRAGTLITPRHIAFANHYPQYVGETVLFIAEDNSVVTRTITDIRRVSSTDIMIGKLDSDVPSSITHYPIIDKLTFEKYLNDGFFQVEYKLPIVTFDQEDHAIVHDTSIKHISDNFIQYVSHDRSISNTQRINFYEQLIGGDSGNPAFVLIGNKPVLILTHFSSKSGPSYGFHKNEVQSVLDSMGGGYTLPTMNLSCFNSPIGLEPLSNLNVLQNFSIGDIVGTVGIKHNIENDIPYFSILGGDQNNVFEIATSTGQITVASSTPLINANSSFLLEIGVAENGPIGRLSKGSYLVNTATAPYFTFQNYNFSIDEHEQVNTVIGGVAASDKQSDVLGYSILSGNNSGIFSIASSTGIISVVNSNLLNYENQTTHTLVVEAKEQYTAQKLAQSINININLNDTNYIFSSSSYAFKIDEMDIDTTVVGNVQAQIIDTNNISQVHYSIVSGNEKNIFSLSSTTGQITIVDNTELDSNNIYNLIIGVSDGFGSPVIKTSNILIKVTSNTRPQASFGSSFSSFSWKDVDEGNNLLLDIGLSSSYTKSIILNLSKISGTALLDSDYTLSTSTLVFLPGETEKNITLNILSDSVFENTEELVLNLVDGVRFTAGVNKSAYIKIINKVPPTPVFSSGGGGGGGGGFNTTQVVLPLKKDLIKNTDNINQVLNIKSAILSITSNNQRDFGINTQGSDVKLLQQILNAQGFIVSKKGPGSKGNETNKFGSATKKALIKLQIKNNLLPATGYFGPKTKLYIKSLIK